VSSHSLAERRAAALEAIARALLELAAIERESETSSPIETLIDRRNCERELGITPRAFVDAAGRDFASFRVSRRLTATKADVLAWMKTRKVQPKLPRPVEVPAPPDPDAFLKAANARFVARVGRPMTDQELFDAEVCSDVGRDYAKIAGGEYTDTPDVIAARIERKLSEEPFRHRYWRSFGLDPDEMDRKAGDLREKLHAEHPEWDWRQRQQAVAEMWTAITRPLSEARRKARAEKRAAKRTERAMAGQLGLKK
jgi:hypothetical protein